MKKNSTELKNAIQAEIETAHQVKLRNGYSEIACILVNKLSEKSRNLTVSFNFTKNVKVGDVMKNGDGSISEVVALV